MDRKHLGCFQIYRVNLRRIFGFGLITAFDNGGDIHKSEALTLISSPMVAALVASSLGDVDSESISSTKGPGRGIIRGGEYICPPHRNHDLYTV